MVDNSVFETLVGMSVSMDMSIVASVVIVVPVGVRVMIKPFVGVSVMGELLISANGSFELLEFAEEAE